MSVRARGDRDRQRQTNRDTERQIPGLNALHATTGLELEQNWPNLVVLPVRMAGVSTKGDYGRATCGFYRVLYV